MDALERRAGGVVFDFAGARRGELGLDGAGASAVARTAGAGIHDRGAPGAGAVELVAHGGVDGAWGAGGLRAGGGRVGAGESEGDGRGGVVGGGGAGAGGDPFAEAAGGGEEGGVVGCADEQASEEGGEKGVAGADGVGDDDGVRGDPSPMIGAEEAGAARAGGDADERGAELGGEGVQCEVKSAGAKAGA